jgi:hypothetical protein
MEIAAVRKVCDSMGSRLVVGKSMAATMNGRVHESLNETLHCRKKMKLFFRSGKAPAENACEFGGAINGQLKGFMVRTMNPFMVVRCILFFVPSQNETICETACSRGSRWRS